MKSRLHQTIVLALVCVLNACRPAPEAPKEAAGVNHEASYRIVIRGNVADVNGLKIESQKTRMKELEALSGGQPITKEYLYPDYYNEFGIEFLSHPWKNKIFGEEWPESQFEQRFLSYMEIELQQTERTEKREKCNAEELKSHRAWIRDFNEDVQKKNLPKEMLITLEQIPCEEAFGIMRPVHPFSGYLEVDGLALPVGRKVSFAEVQALRKAKGLPPLERQYLDERGTTYYGYASKKAEDDRQTWTFAWPDTPPKDPHDRDGSERYLHSICVGVCL